MMMMMMMISGTDVHVFVASKNTTPLIAGAVGGVVGVLLIILIIVILVLCLRKRKHKYFVYLKLLCSCLYVCVKCCCLRGYT